MYPAIAAAILAALLPVSSSAQTVFSAFRAPAGPAAPFGAVTPERASFALELLRAPAADRVGMPALVTWLRQADPTHPSTVERLAPFLESADAQGAPAAAGLAGWLERSLAGASKAVSARGTELASVGEHATRAERESAAGRVDDYLSSYSGYLSAHDAAALRRSAELLRAAARAEDSADRTADALGKPAEDSVDDGDRRAVDRATGLSKPEPKVEAPKPEPAVPEAPKPARKLDGVTLVSYLGGITVLAALGWFASNVAQVMGAWPVTAILSLYVAGLYALTSYLNSRGKSTPAGLVATVGVALVPVTLAAFLDASGLLRALTHGHLFVLALTSSTLAAAYFASRRVKFGLLALPASIAALLLGMDLVDWVLPHVSRHGTSYTLIALGAAMLWGARRFDLRSRAPDYGFWPTLTGLGALSMGFLSWVGWGSMAPLMPWILLGLSHAALVAISLKIDRKAYAITGGLGFFVFVTKLCHLFFHDSMIFPLVVAAMGVAAIYGAVQFDKRYADLKVWLDARG
ncbi:MAG: hypothetical protein HY925_12405 [Elusimicrobia bacterium]|nr:hypothetical protein [Elusimicrobiota bacterium]